MRPTSISRRLRRVLGAVRSQPRNANLLDEDAIYRQLGLSVVTFQALETELVQLASFALAPHRAGFEARLEPTKAGHRRLVDGLFFKTLVDETRTAVGGFLDQRRGGEPAFRERLDELLERSEAIAYYRNKLIHSAYVFLEAGDGLLGIVRSNRTDVDGEETALDQEMLTETSFETEMAEIAEVAFGIGQCRIQLIAWYR